MADKLTRATWKGCEDPQLVPAIRVPTGDQRQYAVIALRSDLDSILSDRELPQGLREELRSALRPLPHFPRVSFAVSQRDGEGIIRSINRLREQGATR